MSKDHKLVAHINFFNWFKSCALGFTTIQVVIIGIVIWTVAGVAATEATTKIPEYKIVVTFSQKAAFQLASSGGTASASATYFVGSFKLIGTEKKELDKNNEVVLGGITMPPRVAEKTIGQRVKVNINVFNNRKFTIGNGLHCGIYTGEVEKTTVVPINCKLIGEK